MRSVALVVVHYRTLRDTLECLDSVLNLKVPVDVQRRVIVVDNASGDDSWENLVEWRQRHAHLWSREFAADELPPGVLEISSKWVTETGWEVVFLRAQVNRGYAAGANLGIRFALRDSATSDLWVLNSDVVLDPWALDHLLNRSENQPPAIYGATLLYQDDPSLVQAAGGARYLPFLGRSRHFGKRKRKANLRNVSPRFDYIIGASMFFSREVVREIGCLPEEFFLYFEETEWCARARTRGMELVWVPEAHVVHKEGVSSGAGGGFRRLSDLSFRYVVRNSLLFTESRHSFWLLTVLLFNVWECFRLCLSGDVGKLLVLGQGLREYWAMRSSFEREVPALGD